MCVGVYINVRVKFATFAAVLHMLGHIVAHNKLISDKPMILLRIRLELKFYNISSAVNFTCKD